MARRKPSSPLTNYYGAGKIPACGNGSMPPGLPRGGIEECGDICVWWYTQVEHRTHVETRLWAFARRSEDGSYWHTSSCVSGFETREAAINAAERKAGR